MTSSRVPIARVYRDDRDLVGWRDIVAAESSMREALGLEQKPVSLACDQVVVAATHRPKPRGAWKRRHAARTRVCSWHQACGANEG